MAYVYRHIRTDKNQPFYIGVGLRDNGYKRAHQSWKDKRSQHWHNIAKNGYEVEILLDDLTVEQAFQKEIEFIALYGRADNGTGILCNHTDGGDRPTPLYGDDNPAKRPEVRERLSAIAKKRMARGVSDETRRRMSEALKGRKPTKPRIGAKVVYQRTMDGELVAVWPNARSAEDSGNGWRHMAIYRVAGGFGKSAYGFRWSYE